MEEAAAGVRELDLIFVKSGTGFRLILGNTKPVLPPVGDPNYILIRDLTDRAINWIRTQHAVAPNKPFFTCFAPGNCHAPHHAPEDWIAKFKGKFDHGWDKQREITLESQQELGVVPANTVLTPRPKELAAWNSLSDDQEKVYARMIEVYAAAVAQGDHEVGRGRHCTNLLLQPPEIAGLFGSSVTRLDPASPSTVLFDSSGSP